LAQGHLNLTFMKKRVSFFLSLFLILVGVCYFLKGILSYLIYSTQLPVFRYFSPSNRLDLSLLFLSYWLIIFGYNILKKNERVLRIASLSFAGVWGIYFFFQLVLEKVGFYPGSFNFYFPNTKADIALFCLDLALSLWVMPHIISGVVAALLKEKESDSRVALIKGSAAVYVGTFLIALSTLALEITLTRLLSVITWYHLAFFVVSTAMMGMTAGAITIYLMNPKWFAESNLNGMMAMASLAYAIVIPITLVLLCRTRMGNGTTFLELLPMTFTCTLPFYFSGMVITMVLTKCRLPIGHIYASDLVGAGLGCLFVLVGLEILDAPSFILSCGVVALAGASSFAWSTRFCRLRRWVAFFFVSITLLSIVSSVGLIQTFKPIFVKGERLSTRSILIDRWNSYSRVIVFKKKKHTPQYWGASPRARKDEKVFQYFMNIDGAASTALRRFKSIDDIYHLRFDVTNIAYYLRPRGGACIIGIGGARDLQSAIMFGHKRVIGIDINPIFVDLLENRFRGFAGIADREKVTLISAEARSFLSKSPEKYSVIQMSLIDTWAATGAGAFTLSENALYTREAWKIFLDRLDEEGIFTVSRWYHPKRLGETGRIISLATAALLDHGIKDPSRHVAMITVGNVATLLLSTHPFSDGDIAALERICKELQFDPAILPGSPYIAETFKKIISADSFVELNSAIEGQPLNYAPPTDETPYFFNMLKLNHLRFLLPWVEKEMKDYSAGLAGGVLIGNLAATLTLAKLILCLLFLTVITVVLPLFLKTRLQAEWNGAGTVLWSGAAYFSLIGAGFMIAEIALLQRLSVFLGHPLYALGIVLCTLIASAGAGSFFSERLPLTVAPWVFVYPIVISLAVLSLVFLLPVVSSNMVSSSTIAKILAAVMVITPIGLLMGVCFPTGMRLVRFDRNHETAWYWALNGIFSVLCSPIAVFISIYFSISTNFWISALCYMMLLLFLPGMRSVTQDLQVPPEQAHGK